MNNKNFIICIYPVDYGGFRINFAIYRCKIKTQKKIIIDTFMYLN